MRNLESKSTNKSAGTKVKMESFFKELTPKQFEDEVMSNSDLSRITFSLFDQLMKDEEIMTRIASELCIHLYENHQRDYD